MEDRSLVWILIVMLWMRTSSVSAMFELVASEAEFVIHLTAMRSLFRIMEKKGYRCWTTSDPIAVPARHVVDYGRVGHSAGYPDNMNNAKRTSILSGSASYLCT